MNSRVFSLLIAGFLGGAFFMQINSVRADEIIVGGNVCQRAVAHVPHAGVAYQPGVDAYGRTVAPADLGGGSSIRIPETIAIDITVDLQKRFGLPADSRLFLPEARIGVVEIGRDGKVSFNGELVTGDEHLAIEAACRAALGLPPIPLEKPRG